MTITELQNIIELYFQSKTNDIYFGDAVYHFNTHNVKYDSISFALQNTEVSEDGITYNYVVTYADILKNSTDNEYFIFDAGLEKMESVFYQLDQRDDIDIIFNHTYTPFKQKFSDVLAGWQVNIAIRTDNDIKCEEEE